MKNTDETLYPIGVNQTETKPDLIAMHQMADCNDILLSTEFNAKQVRPDIREDDDEDVLLPTTLNK